MRRPKVKLSNRKIIFYNTSRDIYCLCCYQDLVESWVLSAPKERYRCLPCALRHNILLDIPKVIVDDMSEEERISVDLREAEMITVG